MSALVVVGSVKVPNAVLRCHAGSERRSEKRFLARETGDRFLGQQHQVSTPESGGPVALHHTPGLATPPKIVDMAESTPLPAVACFFSGAHAGTFFCTRHWPTKSDPVELRPPLVGDLPAKLPCGMPQRPGECSSPISASRAEDVPLSWTLGPFGPVRRDEARCRQLALWKAIHVFDVFEACQSCGRRAIIAPCRVFRTKRPAGDRPRVAQGCSS